jgi:CHAD domain-containing protein
LRKLRRALGPLRDLDVMLTHLEALRVPASCAAGAAWVTQRLLERRGELRRQSARRLSPRGAVGRLEAWVDLEHDVRDAETAAGPLLARVAPMQLQAFAARADGVAGAGKAEPVAAPAAPEPPPSAAPAEDVHGLRVAAKLLRYTLELAEPLGLDVPGSVAKDFKKLQDALGLWHDFVVLTDEMLRAATDAGLPAGRPDVFAEVLGLAQVCWGKSEQSLNRFRKLWGERGRGLVEEVSAVFAERAGPPAAGENGSGSAGGEQPRDSEPEQVADGSSHDRV